MNFLPSKKFVVVFGLVIILVILFFIFSEKDKNYSKNIEKKSVFNEAPSIDSDNDGLLDWEEILWETDPNNPDSDEDGTNDGEEVKQGRNPLVAGPDDKIDLTVKNSVIPKNEGSSFEELTQTEKLAESLVSKYLFYKNLKGGNLDEETKDLIIQSVLGDIASTLPFKEYKVSDLIISGNTSPSVIRNYGNNVGKIIKQNDAGIDIEKTLLSLKIALETENPDNLSDTEKAINGYTKILEKSALVEVPSTAVSIHLDFLNSLSQVTEMLISLQRVFDDPVSGLTAINSFQNIVSKTNRSQKNVSSYFDKNNISYSNTDDGYYFIKNN